MTTEVETSWDEQDAYSPTPPPPPSPRRDEDVDRWIRIAVDAAVVTICVVFVFLQMGPSNVFADTTPAGGDMGAHVWGPAYLRDVLLPSGQVAGWSQDWYDGFPAYQFYMVVPSLLIVALDLGFEGWFALLPAAVAVGAFGAALGRWEQRRQRRRLLVLAGLAVVCIGMPYGVAFKLVAISGIVSMPISAYVFGRLSGLRFPAPAAMSVGCLVFLFYRGFTIYGGNVLSTLAGEFAFSMSLSLALLYLGFMFRGFDSGRHRAVAAVLLGLTALCHVIPAVWVGGVTLIAVLLRWRRSNVALQDWGRVALPGAGLALVGMLLMWQGGGLVGKALLVVGTILLLVALWLGNQSARWLYPVVLVGGMLSAFWTLPFVLRRSYLNDMGWEKLPNANPETGAKGWDEWMEHLLPTQAPDADLRWAFVLAAIGFGVSVALRIRTGIFLGAAAIAGGLAFWLVPQGRLWNARILPFYYLVVILLAFLALVEVVRLVAELIEPRRQPSVWVGAGAIGCVMAIGLFAVALPLGVVPYSEDLAPERSGYGWPSFSPRQVQMELDPSRRAPGWADWNFSGYERKADYREYYEVVSTMERVGDERGCGMSLWEYQPELNRYGTPMALMLLPYWTDGCIGSMEGLYFEASATTPYHFMMQTELSTAPSSAQRDMPYGGFDITRGVQHLQLMGVRYYMAISPQAIQAADTQPDLTQIARSGPWVIYEVANSEPVIGLINEPAVLEDAGHSQESWLEEPRDASGRFFGPSLQWFMNPQVWSVLLATDGPEEWQRIEISNNLIEQAEERSVPLAQVSNIDTESDPQAISFDVDQVGSPVLVKASYFPNWQVEGAEGPWRVAPNLMVVIPTDTHVELHWGTTPVEWLAYALTALGIAGVLLLAWLGQYRYRTVGSTTSSPG